MSEDKAALYRAQSQEIVARLRSFLDEVNRDTEEILKEKKPTAQQVTAYIDRWNYLRSLVFDFNWKATGALDNARDEYNDGMRPLLANGVSNKSSYEERHASYVTKNIEPYKVMRILEKLVEVDLRPFIFHLDRQIRWLEDKRRQIKKDDDDFRYSSSRDFQQ